MSKSRVAPKRPAPKLPASVPLSEVSITWPYKSPYMGEPENRTITGQDLAACLDLVVAQIEDLNDRGGRDAGLAITSYRLDGLAEILDGLAETERPMELKTEAIFYALADYTKRLAVDVRGADPADRTRVADACVKLAAAPAVA